jgi:hypothetical protein
MIQMGWLAAIIGLIALVFFMIIFPGFRYFIIALVVLGGLGIYGWNEMEKKDDERRRQANAAEERAARSVITLRDLALDTVQFKKEQGSSWTLTGNVTNNSKYHLGSLGFIVRVEDCPDDDWAVGKYPGDPSVQADHIQKGCITIGEATTRADVYVPPGQMRAFSSHAIYFEGMPKTSVPRWGYQITEIRAAAF